MKTLPLLHPVILALAALVQLSTLNPQLCAQQATNCTPAPSGLISWWPGDGFALDVAGTNNAALQGGATYAAGEVGQGFVFGGANAYASLPNSFFPFPTSGTTNQPFTFEVWFKTTSGWVILGQQNGRACAPRRRHFLI